MSAYAEFLSGRLEDYDLPQADLDRAAEAMAGLPAAP
jgi:hypothetical protein